MNTCLVIAKDKDEFTSSICRHLTGLGIKVVDSILAEARPNFTVILGGEGTLLGAVRQGVCGPVIVVNTGHLGFLSTCAETEEFSAFEEATYAIERVLLGEFTVTTRHLLTASIDDQTFLSVNDIAIRPLNTNKLVQLGLHQVEDNEEFLIAIYRADGLIVSTPTGSTAYSLSAGGPIIHPSCKAFCVTPICPQGLTQRPLVLPHDTRLRLEPLDNELYISIDGQVGRPINKGENILLAYNSHVIQTVNPLGTYFETLQSKLGWGIRPVK